MPVRVDASVSTDVGTIFLSNIRSDGAVLKYGQVSITVGDTALVVNTSDLLRAVEAIRAGTSMISNLFPNRNTGDIFND